MTDEFVKVGNGYQKQDENGNMIAEITYVPTGEDKVIADHTFVDPSLRGQGMAEKILDHMVGEMRKEGKKIIPLCPYVVTQFKRKPEKYGNIAAKR